MGRRNLDSMKGADLAWNTRQWEEYASVFDEELTVFSSGSVATYNKATHLARSMAFCTSFPDAQVDMTPYLDLFISHDGSKTCSVAFLTGTLDAPLKFGGRWIRPNHRRFSVTVMAICKWRKGKILERRQFFDTSLFAYQLAIPARKKRSRPLI